MTELNFENVERGVSGAATRCCLSIRDSERANILNVCTSSINNRVAGEASFNANKSAQADDAPAANGASQDSQRAQEKIYKM